MKITTLIGTEICFDEKCLSFAVTRNHETWSWDKTYIPKLDTNEGTVLFEDAKKIEHFEWHTGIGDGIRSHYEKFTVDGKEIPFAFETIVWVESASGDVFFEWVPLCEEGLTIKGIFWPGYMEFNSANNDWYTLLNIQQGLLIPNTWSEELGSLLFGGRMGTAGSYMPWFGQVRENHGYIAICEQPWDAFYYAEHPAGEPYTHVGMNWNPSMGKVSYRRIMKYSFLAGCDYNDLCKVYRTYVKEKGTFCTLKEKAQKAPLVDKLIGSAFVHKGIKTQVVPTSNFFDPEAPDKNNHLTKFSVREEEMKHIHKLGLEKLYLHLDGWAEPGYDNCHPDYSPACIEAGGWEGMKSLADTIHKCGYLFGIHDQYRDYYFAAETFDSDFGCRLVDGTIPEHSNWAGGRQTYLCATQAPFYVKRNFSNLEKNGIELDCAYLDVFTCNEGDECTHPWHQMTRKECLDFRGLCFEYLLSKGILTSSEEVTDWSIRSLVFCHYAPYEYMMEQPGKPRKGIAVPLFNLVYHDCVIIPWMMEKVNENEDYMLCALLNGGAPYFIRDGAYQNVDGSFGGGIEFSEEEKVERCREVMRLHEKVARTEMVSHKMVDGNYNIQRTTFSDGTVVTVDFTKQTYTIQ